MAQLKNQLVWSDSRARTLEECARKYYLSYYQSWGGWDSKASANQRIAYRLKKLSARPLWAGDLVHRAIEQALKVHRVRPAACTLAAFQTWLETTAREEWAQSKSKAVIMSPSRSMTLKEHYFNEHLPEGTLEEVITDVCEWFLNWWESDLRAAIFAVPTKTNWLSTEILDQVVIGGIACFVKLDFAFLSLKKKLVVADWKTGKPREADARQLSVYAEYARGQWGSLMSRPEDLRLLDVYLKSSPPRIDQHNGAQVDLDGMKRRVADSRAAMRDLLVMKSVNRNEPLAIEKFPRCREDGNGPCRWCPFYSMCYDLEDPNEK